MVIVEGDGENPIPENAISISIDHAPVALPKEMARWREQVAAEMETARTSGGKPVWNGPNYAIAAFSISRDPLVESPEIFLRLQHSDYYTFLTTQQLDRAFLDGTTPRSRYIDSFENLTDVPAFMASSFGTNMAVVTKDLYLVVSRRSNLVGTSPNLWSSSANEALSRSIDSKGRDVPNLYDVARRGLAEELAIDRTECRLDMLAFTIDVKTHQWGGLFIARLPELTMKGLRARWTRGVSDRWEHAEHAFIPFTVKAVGEYVLDPARVSAWTSVGPPLYYLALVNQYGRPTVEHGMADVVKRVAHSGERRVRHLIPWQRMPKVFGRSGRPSPPSSSVET